MNLEQLKTNLNNIKIEYENKKEKVNSYFQEINNTFYNYAGYTGNYNFEKILNNVVCGEDLYGEDYCKNIKDVSNDLYYFKNYNDISSLNYNIINELVDMSLSYLTKEKEFEIC